MEPITIILAIAGAILFVALLVFSIRYKRQYYRNHSDCHEPHVCDHVHTEILAGPMQTGYNYLCGDGVRRDVWVSPLGKFYVLRDSSNGNQYKQYIHDDYEMAFTSQFSHDYPQHSYIFN